MATVRMPSSLHAQITRSAISPRLAISIFLNILRIVWGQPPSVVRPGEAPQVNFFWKHKAARCWRAARTAADSFLRPNHKQILPVLNRLAVDRQLLDDLSGNVRFNLVEQLHCLNDAEDLPQFHHVSRLHKRRSAW